MKNLFKVFGVIALAAVIGFSFIACDEGTGDDDNDDGITPVNETVILTMTFNENKWQDESGTWHGWMETGNENWCRWDNHYEGANTKTLDSSKAYVLTCTFTSNVDLDSLGVQYIKEDGWVNVSGYTNLMINTFSIPKNTRYYVRVPLFPDSNVSDFLYFMINNRDNNIAPVLSFTQFLIEPATKDNSGTAAQWTVSGKNIKVTDAKRTFAETLSSYNGKNNVFHIKPKYNASTYDHFVMEYDELVSSYGGQTIGISMSMDVCVMKPSRIAWQINSREPYYPVIVGNIEEYFFLPANEWTRITGTNIITIPTSSGGSENIGDKLYLSGMQINGAEAYFANATFTINTNPGADVEPSVEDFEDDEPQIVTDNNPYRRTARVGGTITINKPSSLPSGSVTWTLNSADNTIAQILSSNDTSCSVKGLGVGTARITVTAGGQSVIVYIYISPNQDSYTLPSGDVKTFTTWTWDNGVNIIRPDTNLPTGVTYYYEPTTQLAWYWQNTYGGIDFLAYYVDPANSNRRGWVKTTFSFGGWRYDLNDQNGRMQNGVQTNGNIKLELIPEFVYDKGVPYLQIKHKLTNTGSSRVTNQKFGASADIMLFDNDSAPLKYMQYGALMTNALTNPTIKFRLVCQNVQGVDNVSTLWMGRYGSERSYVYVDKREDVTNMDSAMNFSYRNIDLNAGESKYFVVRFTQIQ